MAEIGQHPDRGGGTHPATFDDVLFSELRTANDHACPGGDAAGLGDGDLDGITGRQVEAVEPRGGLAGEHGRDRKATMDGLEQERWLVGEWCPHVETASDAPPARALEMPPGETRLPRLDEGERTAGELRGNERVPRHAPEDAPRATRGKARLLTSTNSPPPGRSVHPPADAPFRRR